LHAQYRSLYFRLEAAAPTLAIDVDPVLMASAVMNLLHNGFKNTRSGGCVVLRARADETHVRFEVEDECGGIPDAITRERR
jgi:signal transduction histidine kinase